MKEYRAEIKTFYFPVKNTLVNNCLKIFETIFGTLLLALNAVKNNFSISIYFTNFV